MSENISKHIVVGISGASGAAYAARLMEQLTLHQTNVHLIASPLGQRLLHDELGATGKLDEDDLKQLMPNGDISKVKLYNHRDVGATIASGSYQHDGMIIIPCSSNSLACIAQGVQQNLLHRAAAVTLKERRKLVLLHREMPLSLADIRNMQLATEAGAIIAPASPGFYLNPQTIEDLVDFVVARMLDLLGISHKLSSRWKGSPCQQSS